MPDSREIVERQVVLNELDRLLKSPHFASARRRAYLLRYLVQKALEGRAESVTEYGLGLDVFGKPPDFDPRIDTIVRVEMNRLRQRLREYYGSVGAADPVIIEIPLRSYLPTFSAVPAVKASVPAAHARPPRRYWWVAAIAVLTIAAGLALWLTRFAGRAGSSIAVLPFLDLSRNHDSEYFSDGLTDEITGELSHVAGVRVVARTSAAQFKGKPEDIRRIGERLNAAYLVEGSVEWGNGRLRVRAQLNRAADGYHLWSQTYDRDSKDIFTVEDEIARSIAAVLRSHVESRPPRHLQDEEAHTLYLKGRYLWNKRTAGDTRAALELLDRAIARDPGFAPAYALKAAAYMSAYANDQITARDTLEKAIAAASDALGLDPSLAEARATGAFARFFNRQPAEAEREFHLVLELDPNYATAHQWYSVMLMMQRRFHEAQVENRKARLLDPLSLVIAAQEGLWSYYSGDLDRLSRIAPALATEAPGFAFGRGLLGHYYLQRGEFAAAEREYRREAELLGPPADDWPLSFLAIIAARQGRSGEARKIAQQRSPAYAATVYAALGDRDWMYAMLDQAEKDWASGLMIAAVEPTFQNYRAEPRFRALLKRLGLPD